MPWGQLKSLDVQTQSEGSQNTWCSFTDHFTVFSSLANSCGYINFLWDFFNNYPNNWKSIKFGSVCVYLDLLEKQKQGLLWKAIPIVKPVKMTIKLRLSTSDKASECWFGLLREVADKLRVAYLPWRNNAWLFSYESPISAFYFPHAYRVLDFQLPGQDCEVALRNCWPLGGVERLQRNFTTVSN